VVSGRCLRSIQTELPTSYDRNGSVHLNDQDAIVSPRFQYVAYQWRDPTGVRQIHVRELATGKEPPPIHAGGFGGTLAFCFSADEKTLMWDEWYSGNGIVFSDVATGKEMHRLGDKRAKDGTYTGRAELTLAISLSPDGRYLALCRESHTIELWDLRTGKSTYPTGKPTMAQLYHRFPDSVGARVHPALSFSSDSKMLISSLGGAALHQFRVDTGKLTPEPGNAHRAPVCTLALSADGKSLATFGSGDPIHFWEWTTGKESKEEGLPATATHVVFASGGQFAFAVGNQITFRGNGGAKTWRLADEDFPPLMALALSPDGTVLASRNFDNPEVQLWDATGKHRCSLGRLDEGPRFVADGTREAAGVVVPDVVFSPDGRCLAGAGPRRQLCLWHVDTGNLIWEQPSQAGQVIERFAFSPSGHMLASVQVDGTVTLYEASSGAKRAQLGEADQKNQRVYLSYDYYGRVRVHPTRRTSPVCLAFSPDGRYLAMAKDTPTIHLWDVLQGRQVGQLKGHEGGVVSLLFSPDGEHLFSGGADTTVLTWDLARFINRSAGRSAQLQGPALEALWSDLSSKDAFQAFTAMRQLCASPDEAIRLLEQRVRPARAPEPEKLANLIADLDSSRSERRRQAETELAEFGELAEPALRQALAEGPPLNVRQRLEQLLNRLSNVAPTAKLRVLRAVEVVELIGTAEAQQVLERLAGGTATARLTRQANEAIHRLRQQPSAGH
jgi:WD40 repeat protein